MRQIKGQVVHMLVMLMLALMVMGSAAGVTAERAYAQGIDPGALQTAKANPQKGGKFVKRKKKRFFVNSKKETLANQWIFVKGKAYYLKEDGTVATGHFSWNGGNYGADSKGALYVNKWKKFGKQTYYFGATGNALADGWYKIGKTWYAFGEQGQRLKNTVFQERFVGKKGQLVVPESQKDKLKKKLLKKTKGRTSSQKKLIIVGASRVAQMQEKVKRDRGTVYIAKPGAGVAWFNTTARYQLEAYLEVYPNSIVVIQMGNNDLRSHTNVASVFDIYAASFKELMEQYPQASFYFMDALPAKNSNNGKRMEFNTLLVQTFPAQAIGGFAFMEQTGYKAKSAQDPMHYDAGTYRKIYQYICSQVKK